MEHRPPSVRQPYFIRSSHERFKGRSSEFLSAIKSDPEIYFNKVCSVALLHEVAQQSSQQLNSDLEPSEFLIPPSKGIGHDRILRVGTEYMNQDYNAHFMKCLRLLNYNEECWKYVKQLHTLPITKKIDAMYSKIFAEKARKIKREANKFYDDTFFELEAEIHKQLQNISDSFNAAMTKDSHAEIIMKLHLEKTKCCDILRKKNDCELKKIDDYYTLLLNNEKNRVTSLINHEKRKTKYIIEMLQKQYEAERLTSTMYVMSMRRRKCKTKHLLIQNSHKNAAVQYINKINLQKQVLQSLENNEILYLDETARQKNNATYILKLFHKLMSFSSKLLPEQANFFHDFKRIFLTQMHEFETNPILPKQVLVTDNILNEFEWPLHECDASPSCPEPFTADGDLLPPKSPPKIDSRTTLPDDVELPFMRLNRQFVYAKCDTFDEVQKFVEKRKAESSFECECFKSLNDQPTKRSVSDQQVTSAPTKALPAYPCSSVHFESDQIEEKLSSLDLNRLEECPLLCDKVLRKHLSFPLITQYLDYTDEKYIRVKTFMKDATVAHETAWIDIENILKHEPYKATTERSHDVSVQTQFSAESIRCPCNTEYQEEIEKRNETIDVKEIMAKRKNSLMKTLHKSGRIFDVLQNDESYNFLK